MKTSPLRFEGSTSYVATNDLKLAVNAALTLQRPLLIKGEPGTGKTMLAEEVAGALTMPLLVRVHFPTLKNDLLTQALTRFYEVREVAGIKKKPSTSELLDWLKLLLAENNPVEALHSKDQKTMVPSLHGALLKNEQDVHLFERIMMMSRQNR